MVVSPRAQTAWTLHPASKGLFHPVDQQPEHGAVKNITPTSGTSALKPTAGNRTLDYTEVTLRSAECNTKTREPLVVFLSYGLLEVMLQKKEAFLGLRCDSTDVLPPWHPKYEAYKHLLHTSVQNVGLQGSDVQPNTNTNRQH